MSATLIMPVYNGSKTLEPVLAGLEAQKFKRKIEKLIFIDDASSDSSLEILNKYAHHSSFKVEIIHHSKNAGLAANYNEGIKLAHTPIAILMHQDILLTDDESFLNLLRPIEDSDILSSCPYTLTTLKAWSRYNFWQQCMFSRFVDKKGSGFSGKFDALNVKKIQSLGLFNNATYRTAGEDSDLIARAEKAGEIFMQADVTVMHITTLDERFGVKQWARKEAQYAEAQGAVQRMHPPRNLKSMAMAHFRTFLILGLLIPYLQIVSLALILIYAFTYTALVYQRKWRDTRIFLLPFINVYMLVISAVYSIRGFLIAKQVV